MHFHGAGRRGSYIVEAAAVLPFVILAVITTVLIIMFFYESSVSESRMHMALRCEAGLITEKFTCYSEDGSAISPEDIWDGSITSSGIAPAKRVSGSSDVAMVSRGLLSRLGRRSIEGELRAADPVSLLRIRQIAGSDDGSGGGDGDGGNGDGDSDDGG